MKALVIRQPWAELIVSGRKTIEVRKFRTKITDEFLVVAGKTVDAAGMKLFQPRPLPGHESDIYPPIVMDVRHVELAIEPGAICTPFPVGMAVGIARVYKIEPFNSPEHERQAFVTWDGKAELWAWHLGNIRRIKPFYVRGMPGFFNVDPVGG